MRQAEGREILRTTAKEWLGHHVSWVLLGLGIVLEVVGTTCLKLSNGLSRPWPSLLMFAFYGLSLTTLAVAFRDLDLGIAYTLWSALGLALIVSSACSGLGSPRRCLGSSGSLSSSAASSGFVRRRCPGHDDGGPAATRVCASPQPLYDRLAPVYDLVYGLGLQQGRNSRWRDWPRSGGGNLRDRYRHRAERASVSGGLSGRGNGPVERLLTPARRQLARRGPRHVALCQMDARLWRFATAVRCRLRRLRHQRRADPVKVAQELTRVCRRGGRLVLLNHFAAR